MMALSSDLCIKVEWIAGSRMKYLKDAVAPFFIRLFNIFYYSALIFGMTEGFTKFQSPLIN